MKKSFYDFWPLLILIACASPEEIDPDLDPVIENKAPENFEVYLDSVSSENAYIRWSNSKDPEGESITYNIYLNDSLIQKAVSGTEFILNELNELSLYRGKVEAQDSQGNQTAVNFEFTTTKYYLNFISYLDFGIDPKCVQGAAIKIFEAVDGNFLALGKAAFNGYSYLNFASKIDPFGNLIWIKHYPYDNGEVLDFNATKSKTGFFIVSNDYILKLDYDGNEIWVKEMDRFNKPMGGIGINDILEDSNGDIYIIGDGDSNNRDVIQLGVLMKLDQFGNILWEREYDKSFRNRFDRIIFTSDDNLMILGSQETKVKTFDEYLHSNSSQIDFWLLSMNKEGEIIWEHTYGDERYDFPKDVIELSNGNFTIAGFSWGEQNHSNARLIEVDTNGLEVWNHTNEFAQFFSVKETSDQGLILVGRFDSNSYQARMGLNKFNKNREEEWNRIYGESMTNILSRDIMIDQDGGFRIVASRGNLSDFDCVNKLLFIKTDPSGNFQVSKNQ